ncbi:MAG: hypothetical protein RLZZ08_1549 [Pseudomonadota bacterium]|jgi:tetratricopeptide (TPR) repeat protein
MICTRDLKRAGAALLVAGLACAAAAAVAAAPGEGALQQAAAAIAQGDGIMAEVAARQAMQLGRARADVAAYLGEAELLQGDGGAAHTWLDAGQFSPASQQRGFHALGRLQLDEGDFAGAAQSFNRALASGPATAGLWVDIGAMRYRSGQQHLALDAAERAVALGPDDPQALSFRAQLARDSGGLLAALPWFERAVAKAPQDIGLLGEYAATLGDAGRYRAMLQVARRMVELNPRHPRAYYLQAVLAMRAGKVDLARRLMWKTGGEYDDLPAGLLLNGTMELASDNPRLAVEQFDHLVRLQPQNQRAQRLIGRALLANGEANEVVARFAAQTDRRDAPPYLLTLMGRALEQLGQRQRAAPYLDRAAGPLAAAITVLPVDADGDFAIWRWSKDPGNAEAAVPLLRKLVSEGRMAEAQAQASRMLVRYPGSADVERLAGDVRLLGGDAAGALSAYDRSAAIRNDNALLLRTVWAERALGRADKGERRKEEFLAQNPRWSQPARPHRAGSHNAVSATLARVKEAALTTY